MMSGFYQALPVVLELEGGYSADPDDRGGHTNYGVTQATYDAWRRTQNLPTRPVRRITMDEVHRIYHHRYWLDGKCDALPWPLSGCHFDACVNHGTRNAWKLMQRALGVADDGIPGPITMAAVEEADTHEVLSRWWMERLDFYYRITQNNATQKKFLLGWVRRMVHLYGDLGRAA